MLKFIFLMVLSASCFADEWTDGDTKREAVFLVVNTIDWGQTLNIARHPNQFYETNTHLGLHPSVAQVNKHFAIKMLENLAIAYVLPKSIRPLFQAGSIGYELNYVERNFSLHIGIQF